MKQKTLVIFFLASILTLLSGCTRYTCWLKDIFTQGAKVETHVALVTQYIRSEHIYDQFTTLAHFDALWLSDQVRSVYAVVYAQKHCLSRPAYCQLLNEQLEHTKQTISFYVLSAIRNNYGSELLDDPDAEWSMCLQIGSALYKPITIEEVELSPEYVMFFGKRYTRFKTIYRVDFNAKDSNGNPLIHAGVPSIMLWFNRIDRKTKLVWCLDSSSNVIMRVDHDPNILSYCMPCR